MLTFLIMKVAQQLDRYMAHWGQDLAGSVRIVAYEDAPRASDIEDGTCVFCDIERYPPQTAAFAEALADALGPRDGVRILNRPGRAMDRVTLLRALHQRGTNSFAVHEVGGAIDDIRFPVFVRRSREHDGALTPLVHDRRSLLEALRGLYERGLRRRQLLIVEYVDVGVDGVWIKHGALRIDGLIIAQSLPHDTKWMVKAPGLPEPDYVARELDYQTRNPHCDEVMAVFELAGIEFGRMDYGLRDGRIEVWEINTHPMLLHRAAKYHPSQLPGRVRLAAVANEALLGLAG